MGKKRTKLEVIRDILEVIKSRNGKIKPTHILYKSNLSYGMMEEYMRDLLEKQFIVEHKTKEGKRYSITERGQQYLQKFNEIVEFTERFGLE